MPPCPPFPPILRCPRQRYHRCHCREYQRINDPSCSKPPPSPQRWWNADLSNIVSEIRRQAKIISSSNNPYLKRHFSRSKATLKARICKEKEKWATDHLEGANKKNMWDFISWYSSGKRKHPLYTSPTQVPTSDEERAKSFISQFFPPPPPVAPYIPPDFTHHTRGWAPLMREEVSEALNSCKDDSAPGPSQVTYKAVKWAWEAHSPTLWYLFSHCINLGHYPTPFKTSITSVVGKPNKADYTKPSSFRPIQLMECPGKALEKLLPNKSNTRLPSMTLSPAPNLGVGPSPSPSMRAYP